jgi:hypothetical protein
MEQWWSDDYKEKSEQTVRKISSVPPSSTKNTTPSQEAVKELCDMAHQQTLIQT